MDGQQFNDSDMEVMDEMETPHKADDVSIDADAPVRMEQCPLPHDVVSPPGRIVLVGSGPINLNTDH